MLSDRQILEMNARLIDALQVYRRSDDKGKAGAVMAAEVRGIAKWFADERLSGEEMESRVVRPVAEELCERYGREEGMRLHAEFMRSFRGVAAGPVMPATLKA